MSAFIALTRESIRDGIRRRVVPAIVGVSLLSLVGINSCGWLSSAPAVVRTAARNAGN